MDKQRLQFVPRRTLWREGLTDFLTPVSERIVVIDLQEWVSRHKGSNHPVEVEGPKQTNVS